MKQHAGMKRRQFMLAMTAALAGSGVTSRSFPQSAGPSEVVSVQDVIDLIIASTPGGRKAKTVDTVKTGDPEQKLTGVATTFMATYDVIQKAAGQNLNLIITHEPTFYNHLDETKWLESSRVFQAKKALLEQHGIVVWRFHDYWHMHSPDPMFAALVKEAGWRLEDSSPELGVITLPETSLRELAAHIKERLSIRSLRLVGDPDMKCRRASIFPGAAGGRAHIGSLIANNVDVLICGELSEWETSEYVRDANASGNPLGLIVTGHAVSEEFGMRLLVDWLGPKVPGIPVDHIPAGDAFHYL